MKKIIHFMLGLILFTGLATLPGRVQAQEKTPSKDKKPYCERCKRGSDGKMVCEKVECPKPPKKS